MEFNTKVDIVETFYGKGGWGAELSCEIAVLHLVDKLERLRVLSTRTPDEPKPNLFVIPNVEFLPNNLLRLGSPLTDEWVELNLKKAIIECKPDVLHQWDTYTLPSTLKVAKKLKIPLVVSMRNNVITPTIGVPSILVPWFHLRDKTILKCLLRADALISVSDHIKNELIMAGMEEEKVTTIYNIRPLWECQKIRSSKQKEGPVIFACGRLCRAKGFHVLINSLGFFADALRGQNGLLIIAGEGPNRRELEAMVRSLHFDDVVKFCGRVPPSIIKDFYLSSDIVVIPTIIDDPFPRVVMETMACEKPVVASKVGGIPEIVEDGITGFLVKPNCPGELAEAIIRLLEDEELRRRMGHNARRLLLLKNNPEKISNEIVNVYRRVFEKS